MKIVSTSEYVSLGHPDATSDGIVAYLTDKYLERDPMSRIALECQFKDNYVTVSGELTSNAGYTDDEIKQFVREAVAKVGYTKEYQSKFGRECVVCDEDLDIVLHISKQSPDIAQGVTGSNAGWGDQGIYWGMAVPDAKTEYLPLDYYLARKIAQNLFNEVRESDSTIPSGGLDIKTQVTLEDGEPRVVVVAIPSVEDVTAEVIGIVYSTIQSICGKVDPYALKVIINGTGKYQIHSSVGDCGTTGRKLAVNFYGGNCRIGGGAVFGKDPSKSDVALNCYARYIALKYMKEHGCGTTYCSIAGCIGKPEIRIAIYDESNKQLETWTESKQPDEIIGAMKLREPKWFSRCWYGLFGDTNDSI